MRATTWYTCAWCGKGYLAKNRNYKPTCSLDCGIKRMAHFAELAREAKALQRSRQMTIKG